MIRPISTMAMVSMMFASSFCCAGDRVTGLNFATRSEVIARHGAAATSQPLATQIALDILKQGGNAVDAAIAANAALGLMEPTGCGIGGDLFAIVWNQADRTLYGLNASGRSPQSLKLEEFQRLRLSKVPAHGPLPVSVPGCVDGWFELHERFGKLPIKDVLAPAIGYATEGFPVTQLIAAYWNAGGERLREYPGFADTFLPGGVAPGEGEMFRNEALARTLTLIAKEGRAAFYEGNIANTIDQFMHRNGGFLTYDDLASHESEWVEPVSIDYRGYRLWELPPNGQGIAALQILGILKGYDLRSAGFGSVDHLHWFIEAKKLAFEDRAHFYADPAFHEIPVAELISDDYAAERRALINSEAAAPTFAPGNPALEEGDTVYLAVADAERNMVSLIQSNYRGFGSGMCPDGLGFCLQNRGELFDLTPGRFNTYAPRKRPFHTIIPAFVTRYGDDGGQLPYISFGVMGGATQPQAHAQVMMNLFDFDMNLQEAGDAPRVVHGGSSQPTGSRMKDGGTVHLETGFGDEVRAQLEGRGHHLGNGKGIFGGYQAIRYDHANDVYRAASESRKDGHAAGY